MATLEKVYNKDITENKESLKSAMPSRAKYFCNNEAELEQPVFKGSSAARYASYKEREPDTQHFNGINIENEELKRDINAGNPDILPTGATLKMLRNGQTPAKPFDNTTAVSYKVNAKGKLLFALYAVIVLSLVLVIVFNALAIERQNNANANIENQISLMGATVDTLATQSESLSDTSYIQSQAQSLGMTEIKTTSIKIKMPQLAKKTELEPVTNWFDWFCDIFS